MPILIPILFPWFYIFILLPVKLSLDRIRTYRHCTRHGKEMTGTIVGYEHRGVRSGYSPVFSFRYKRSAERKPSFQQFEFFVKTGFPKNAEMQIYYCETHPDFVIIKGYDEYIFNAVIGLLFLCLFIIVAVAMLLRELPGTLASFAVTAAILFLYAQRKKRKNR